VDSFTVDNQVAFDHFYAASEFAVNAVKLQQVCERVYVGQVIDGYNSYVLAVNHLSEGKASNSAKAVDGNLFHIGLNSLRLDG
jgi:hypothetical protein